MDALVVSELYDKVTFQGEGPHLGKPTTFMRLGACNLKCGAKEEGVQGWRCDSSYTWDWTGINGIKYDPKVELRTLAFDEITAWLKEINDKTRARILVITGGEPLLQDKAIAGLLARMMRDETWGWWRDWQVHVETNGTIIPHFSAGYVNHFSVSPKLANSGNALAKRYILEALDWFSARSNAHFKFVASLPEDFREIDAIVHHSAIRPDHVWIMPEGVTTGAIDLHLVNIVDSALERGYNITTRLHINVFGNTRGT